MKVKMGERELEMDSRYLTWLRESNDILDDPAALKNRLSEDGYLLIRGFHEKEDVSRARKEMFTHMHGKGYLNPDAPIESGVIGKENQSFVFRNDARSYPEFVRFMNSPRTLCFFESLLGDECITYETKWFRAVGKGGFTGAHYDIVYMGRGTKQVYTVWTPLMEIPLELGGLAICLGSQSFEKVRNTYGKTDYEKVSG